MGLIKAETLIYVKKQKDIEFAVVFPLTRLRDCTRLMFKPGDINGWFDIDSDPEILPIYQCPRLRRKRYRADYWGGFWLYPSETYNGLVRQISETYQHTSPTQDDFIWGIKFKKSGSVELGLVKLNI